MVARIFIIVSVACVFNLADGLTAPFPGFKPCKFEDEACVLQNVKEGIPYFTDGIPELGVERLDPEFFERVDSSTPSLKFIITNVTSTGLKTCVPLSVKHNGATSNLVIKFDCNLKLEGFYELDGNILLVRIAGEGKLYIHLKHFITTISIDYVIKEGKDGKRHIRIKKFDHTYELKEKSDILLDSLFQENTVLNQAAMGLISNNGNEVIQEIGVEMIKASMTRSVKNINTFFGKLNFDEITIT